MYGIRIKTVPVPVRYRHLTKIEQCPSKFMKIPRKDVTFEEFFGDIIQRYWPVPAPWLDDASPPLLTFIAEAEKKPVDWLMAESETRFIFLSIRRPYRKKTI